MEFIDTRLAKRKFFRVEKYHNVRHEDKNWMVVAHKFEFIENIQTRAEANEMVKVLNEAVAIALTKYMDYLDDQKAYREEVRHGKSKVQKAKS